MGSQGEAGGEYMMRKRVREDEEVCRTVRLTEETRATNTEQAGRSCLSVTPGLTVMSVCLSVCLSVTPGQTVRSDCLLSSTWSVCLCVSRSLATCSLVFPSCYELYE